MEDQIRKMVFTKTKYLSVKLTQETGISPSLEEQDIKEYLVMAINEVKQARAAGKSVQDPSSPSILPSTFINPN